MTCALVNNASPNVLDNDAVHAAHDDAITLPGSCVEERTPPVQASAEELSVNGFRTVMEIDTIGTFAMSRAAFPAMSQRGGGRVVNISATLHYGATWWQVTRRKKSPAEAPCSAENGCMALQEIYCLPASGRHLSHL